MQNDRESRIVGFDTEAEAQAFIDGLEYCDNDHVTYEGPFEQEGQWRIEVTEFV